MLVTGCDYSTFFQTNLKRKDYASSLDSDHDGIVDKKEINDGLNPDDNDADGDPDGDGLTNYWEAKLGFDPHDGDSGSSLYGMGRAKNGKSDCDEDLNGDGVPICWKIKYKIDPVAGDARVQDSDGDGFSDAEEYAADTDPTAVTKHPGGETPILVLYGSTGLQGITGNPYVQGTLTYCAPGDEILFSPLNVQPLSTDPRWVTCTTKDKAFSGLLGNLVPGTQHMYAWRKGQYGTIQHPVVGDILYDVTAPTGALSVAPTASLQLTVTITPPTDATYTAVSLARFAESDCSAEAAGAGTAIKIGVKQTSYVDDGLSLATPYCYKIFWTDEAGNVAAATAVYAGNGPTPGGIDVASLAHLQINLRHTPPTDPTYTSVQLYRYVQNAPAASPGCAGGDQTTYDRHLAPGAQDTTVDDATGLQLGKEYCYKAFWYDKFGNYSTGETSHPYLGLGPTAGVLTISSLSPTTINLTVAPPSDATYASMTATRYATLNCTGATGTPPSPTANQIHDSGLSLATDYCYTAAWYDAFGNFSTSTVTNPYAGSTSPSGGALTFASRTTSSLTFTHTVPTSPFYSSVILERKNGVVGPAGCNAIADNGGDVTVAMNATDTTVVNSGLAADTDYCYKIFWKDGFGNETSAQAAVGTKTLPTSGVPSPNQTTWYLGNGSSFSGTDANAHVTYTITYGGTKFYSLTPSNVPSFLALSPTPTYPTTSAVYTGTPAVVLTPAQAWSLQLDAHTSTYQIDGSTQVITFGSSSGAFDALPASVSVGATTPTTQALTATLDTPYDGTHATLSYLLSDADVAHNGTTVSATLTGTAAYARSDIPGLKYASGTSSCPATATVPYFCSLTSSLATNVVTGGFKIGWTSGTFDQGSYDVRVYDSLNVDSAQIYGPLPASGAGRVNVTVPDPGNEPVLINSNTIGESNFFQITSWNQYQPALALDERQPNDLAQSYGVVYPAFHANYNLYVGVLSIDRAVSTSTLVASDFSDDAAHQLSATSGNSGSTSIVSAVGSTSPEWITLTGAGNGSGQDLVLNDVFAGSPQAILYNVPVSTYGDATTIASIATSPAFTDTYGSKARHALAFFGYSAAQNSNKLYVSKFASVPTTAAGSRVKADYFDAGSYYDASNDLPQIPSVAITGELGGYASLVHVSTAREDTGGGVYVNYAYVGYRRDFDNKLYFVKVKADGNASPTKVTTHAGDELAGFDATSGQWGRPAFGMAAGADKDGNPVLGVLYSQDDSHLAGGVNPCLFQAYKVSSGELAHVLGASLTLPSTGDCRFPHLFYGSGKFMAVWVEGAGGATKYAEFTLDETGGAFVPASPTAVQVTASRGANKVCNLAAQFSPTTSTTPLARIGLVSVEDSDCSASHVATMRFDLYKPAR